MNKKILIITGIIFLILLASVFMLRNRNSWKDTKDNKENSKNLCNSVPAQYKTKCEQGNAWLDQKLVELKAVDRCLLTGGLAISELKI